jgi:signal transduction histidine kinase
MTQRFDVGARRPLPGWLAGLMVLGAAVAALGLVHPAYFTNLGARAALETMITMAAIAAAALLVARFGQTRTLRDLLLLTALVTVSLVDFPSSVLPAMVGAQHAVPGPAVQLVAQGFIAVAFLAAAFAPGDVIVAGRRKPLMWLLIVGVVAIAMVDLGPMLTHDYAAKTGAHEPSLSAAIAHPALLTLQIVGAVLMLLAAVGFMRNGDRSDQEPWMLATASILLVAARIQYIAFPTVDADWVTPASILRVLGYCLLLATAVRYYVRMRREAADAAIVAERERIARDLHDGLAQDLAFIAAHGDRLAAELGTEHPVAIAAKRALALSRATMVDLSKSTAPSTIAALEDLADELEQRYDIQIEVLVDRDRFKEPTPTDREELVRIAREAIVNAVKHGEASNVTVELGTAGRGMLLSVRDDGHGIDQTTGTIPGLSGFGLPTMRARAGTLGARLVARPAEDGGTEVRVVMS